MRRIHYFRWKKCACAQRLTFIIFEIQQKNIHIYNEFN